MSHKRRYYACVSPSWWLISKEYSQCIEHLLLHYEVGVKFWSWLLEEAGSFWVFPQSCSALMTSKLKAFGGGKTGKVLCWLCLEERIQDVRLFWDHIKFWASLWASTTKEIKYSNFINFVELEGHGVDFSSVFYYFWGLLILFNVCSIFSPQ